MTDDPETWFEAQLIPVSKAVAMRWGVLSAISRDLGTPDSTIDRILAATALEHNLTLATRNVQHFAHLGVPILSPWDA